MSSQRTVLKKIPGSSDSSLPSLYRINFLLGGGLPMAKNLAIVIPYRDRAEDSKIWFSRAAKDTDGNLFASSQSEIDANRIFVATASSSRIGPPKTGNQ
jgi:hypothetical protein